VTVAFVSLHFSKESVDFRFDHFERFSPVVHRLEDKRGLLVDRQKRVMGKKKKKGGGKKKKKAVATSGDMTPEEKMQFLESQANYMERELGKPSL